jgi:hypothetical protein
LALLILRSVTVAKFYYARVQPRLANLDRYVCSLAILWAFQAPPLYGQAGPEAQTVEALLLQVGTSRRAGVLLQEVVQLETTMEERLKSMLRQEASP